MLRQAAYDAILMDIHMPDLSGVLVTRVIRQEWPADQQPRIIALTASSTTQDRQDCQAAGMDDYINKPIRLEELEQALRRCTPRSPLA